jgi:hypothetical protein
MRTQLALIALAVGLLSVAGCQGDVEDDFQEFSSPEGGFRVDMPGRPSPGTRRSRFGEWKEFVLPVGREAEYLVAYLDLTDADAPDQVLNDVVGVEATSMKGKVESETKVTLDGKYPGRDVRIPMPNRKGMVRSRVYVVGKRLYQVTVAGSVKFVDTASPGRFLDSFALLP